MKTFFVFLKMLEPEIWLFFAFVAGSLVVNGNKKYMVMLVGYVAVLYFVSGNMVRALWLAFVSAFLFDKVVVLLVNYPVANEILHQIPNKEITMNFSFAFADVLLLPLIYFARKQKLDSWSWGRLDGLILVMMALGLTSSVVSPLPFNYAWFGLLKTFVYVVVFYLARVVVEDKKIVKATMEVLIFFALFNAGLMILQKLHGGPLGLLVEDMTFPYGRFADEISSLYRPGGISWNSNLTGSILLMILSLVLGLSGREDKKYGKAWIVIILTLLGGIFLTASRFVWMVTLLVLLLFGWKFRQKIFLIWNSIGNFKKSLICGLVALVVLPSMATRLATLSATDIYHYRFLQYSTAVDIISNRVFGVGLDGYRYFVLDNYLPKDYGYSVTPPHNLFLEIGSSIGIGGVVVFILMFLLIFRLFLINWKRSVVNSATMFEAGVLVSLVVYFLVNQAYTSWYSASMTKLFWLLLGFLYVGQNKRKNS